MTAILSTLEESATFQTGLSGFTIASPELQKTAGVFVQNMERLELLAFLPIYLVGFGGMLQAVWSQASTKHTGRSQFWDEDSDIPSVRNEVAALLNERWSNDTFLTRYRSITKHSKIESELNDAENFIDEALREFLAAQLILCWTMFENTAKDLLIAAGNCRTQMIGKSLAQRQDSSDQNSGKSLRLNVLEKYGWNLHGKLGDAFASRIEFSNLGESKKAYAEAFSEKDKTDPIFSCADLRTLHLIRNLFVHCAGRADERFIESVQKSKHFENIKLGEAIHLSTEQARFFSRVTIQRASELFQFVDQWLTANPEK